MRRTTRPVVGLILLLVLFGLALGCRQEVPPLFRRNEPPETTLTVVPEDSAQGLYQYHVYWRGDDTDGKVIRYLFAITDTLSRNETDNWNPELAEDRDRGAYTSKTDSVFVFNSEVGHQAISIVAIDDFGRRDRTPARAYFRVVAPFFPKVQFLDVRGFRDDGTVLPPCVGADPCTIATYTNFKVRFTGREFNNRLTGFQWQGIRPGEEDPLPPSPGASDSIFLPAGRDTVAMSGADTLFALSGAVVSVFFYNRYGDSIPSGNFIFNAKVKDQASRVSIGAANRRRITVNYDPSTVLFRVPACDCPNAPPDCATRPPVVGGWITGVDGTALVDSSQWFLFCEGDTLPQRSWLRFYARGDDDHRDLPINRTLDRREVGFSERFQWTAADASGGQFANFNMPFSSEYQAQDYVLPPPYGTGWRGHRNGWGSVDIPGACPFDFTYFGSAVDEWGRRDGTPDSIGFYVSASPVMDSVIAPSVIVFAPTGCLNPANCPDLTGISFGPDTVMVRGRPVGAGFAACGIKRNQFILPLRAYGHDHPRDRSQPGYNPNNLGVIKSWRFTLDCIGSCEDLALPGEGQWRKDNTPGGESPNQQIFDDTLRVEFVLDTLVVGSGFCEVKAVVPPANLGVYRFTIQGRDTRDLSESCIEPSDLGPSATAFPRPTAEVGRRTQMVVRTVEIRQLQDVRPYVHRSSQKLVRLDKPGKRLMR